jgi:hypothetical protein
MQNYEIKALLRMAMKVGNKTHLMGWDCDKIVRERFNELMKEKENKEVIKK